MTKSQKAHPTHLNDTEWEQIAPYFSEPARTGRPRQHSWRKIMDAIFYITKEGCRWQGLPKEYPPWKTVYHYFRLFRKNGVWEKISQKISISVRIQAGREPTPSAMVIDSQSAKSSEGGENIGFDGGKRVHGRKRTVLVDTQGTLVMVMVTSAHDQDVHIGKAILTALAARPELCVRLETIFADGGYRGELEDWAQEQLKVKLEIVLKPKDQKGFQILPKRWVVERTFAWLGRYRRMARDYERLPENSEAFICIAMIRQGLMRLARC